MIEIKFSAISKQCLNRRIATKDLLDKEVMANVKVRQKKKIKIDWQFLNHLCQAEAEQAS